MTSVTPSSQGMSRHAAMHVAPLPRQPLPRFGTVVAHCSKQSDADIRHWIQAQDARGDRVWWPSDSEGPALGTFLRLDATTESIHPLPDLLPESMLKALYRLCAHPADLDRLLWLIEGLQYPELRGFMLDVLKDPGIALPLVYLSASCRHHHSEPGGLLRHTVECGTWVQTWSSALPVMEADVTLVATLCHDIGKTQTITLSQTTSDSGQMVSHEVMGLQVLQPHLAKLRQIWPQVADALLHMLSWKPSRQEPLPRLPGLVMLKHADQLSTVMDLRNRAFEGYPKHYFWSKPHADQAQRFHRLG